MGIDIYSGRGIVFTVDEFLKIIRGNDKSDVVAVCHHFYDQLVKDADCNSDNEWKSKVADRFKPLSTLKTSMKLSDIREIIESAIEVGGEVSKYGECYITDREEVEDLFREIFNACSEADDLPHIAEVTAWGSGRNNGWDVPKGVACVVFDSESCFERTLSDQGKAVKKLFGHCDETEWTEMSC